MGDLTAWPTSRTRVAGVIGSDASNSLSPVIHNAALRELGLDWVYVAFEVPGGSAGAAMTGMRAMQISGLSVTMPHKRAVLTELDTLTGVAEIVGAVNTVSWSGDRLVGDNTDVAGFVEGLLEATGADLEGVQLALIGTGGAARAAVWAAISNGAAGVTIAGRRQEAVDEIVTWALRAADQSGPEPKLKIAGCLLGDPKFRDVVSRSNIIVSAVPTSSSSPSELLDVGWIADGACVFDLAYGHEETPLVLSARDQGLVAASGLQMLIAQAALQVEIWTGHAPNRTTMEGAAIAALVPRSGAA